MRKHIALFTTVAALAITPALAQTDMQKQDTQPAPQAQPSTPPAGGQATQAPAAAGEKFINVQTSDQWLASDIMGARVVGNGDENIGSISDLLVDPQGNILAAVVGVGGFLGIGQKDVAISFESFNLTRDQNGNEQARLTMTKEELENAPEFKTAEAVRRETERQTSPATKPAAPTPRN